MLQRVPEEQDRRQTLGNNSCEFCQGARAVPCHEEDPSQEPEVDHCGRPDRLRLLSAVHQENRGGPKDVSEIGGRVVCRLRQKRSCHTIGANKVRRIRVRVFHTRPGQLGNQCVVGLSGLLRTVQDGRTTSPPLSLHHVVLSHCKSQAGVTSSVIAKVAPSSPIFLSQQGVTDIPDLPIIRFMIV